MMKFLRSSDRLMHSEHLWRPLPERTTPTHSISHHPLGQWMWEKMWYTIAHEVHGHWPGFPAFNGNKIPWFFPDGSWKFQDHHFDLFLAWNIFNKQSHHKPCNHPEDSLFGMDTRRESLTTGQSKFPDLKDFSQIPWLFPDWKKGKSFSRFPPISRWAGNPACSKGEAANFSSHSSHRRGACKLKSLLWKLMKNARWTLTIPYPGCYKSTCPIACGK